MNDGPALGPLKTQSRSGREKIWDIKLQLIRGRGVRAKVSFRLDITCQRREKRSRKKRVATHSESISPPNALLFGLSMNIPFVALFQLGTPNNPDPSSAASPTPVPPNGSAIVWNCWVLNPGFILPGASPVLLFPPLLLLV